MALNATMYRFQVDVSDLDRQRYFSSSLHVALHPSETAMRMLMRVLVWCLNAEDDLVFTKGLSTEAEPDIWQLDLNGEIAHWIELGTPDLKRVRRALARSRKVSVYAYGGQAADQWWQRHASDFRKQDKLRVWSLPDEGWDALVQDLERGMSLTCIIDDGDCSLSWPGGTLNVRPAALQSEQR